MPNYFTYNGINSYDYATYLSGAGAFDLPVRDVTKVAIPGRNGDLIVDNGKFQNVKVKYPIIIMGDYEEFKRTLVHELSSYVGYKRLEDTFMPDYYRMAYFDGIEEPTTSSVEDGHFTIVFDCKPQLYLKSGEDSVSVGNGESLYNPTKFNALPLIKVTGTGGFSINDDVFNLLENTGVTYIDSELREVYQGTINRNDDFERHNNDLPKLYPGDNHFLCDSGVSLEVVSRWWTI